MMLWSILHTTYTIPYSVDSKSAGLFGDGGLSLKKCMPPARLRAFGQDKWEASLWTHRAMSLRLCRMVASGFVARLLRSRVIFFAVFDLAKDCSEAMVLRATKIVLSTAIP